MCKSCCEKVAKIDLSCTLLIAFVLLAIFITVIINIAVLFDNAFACAVVLLFVVGGLSQTIFFGLYTQAVTRLELRMKPRGPHGGDSDDEERYRGNPQSINYQAQPAP